MCIIEADETADVFTTQYRVARKGHRCHTCGAAISKSERYLVTTTISRGGRPQRTKACCLCATMWEDFRSHHDAYYATNWLSQMLSDCSDDALSINGRRLTPKQRLDFYASLSEEDKKWRRYLAVLTLRQHRNSKTKNA